MQLSRSFKRNVDFGIHVFTHKMREARQFDLLNSTERALNVAIDKFESPLIQLSGPYGHRLSPCRAL